MSLNNDIISKKRVSYLRRYFNAQQLQITWNTLSFGRVEKLFITDTLLA